ncbi:hypothetical protein K504DRAFT_472396 [Pleomassaria siparia CBS 279.74]|uniref:Serine/threonine-protein kinase ppk6 n=1 Tax=Pleomassaria siparia CBS 279.74 TaxID=1314801 RepID=A0A6G1KKF7_9PLEO|nr:hypothetical protein K504DRAFT_472396 [Pleomassaria siparia CBS 279.74]
MSADLFAEFAAPSQPTTQPFGAGPMGAQPAPTFSFFDDFSNMPAPGAQPQTQSFQNGEIQAATVDDDWGDFETVSTIQPAPAPVKQDPFAFTSSQLYQPSQSAWQKAPIVKAKKSPDSNVLFDAEDDADEDEDDFGDFQGVDLTPAPTIPQASSQGGPVDLLGDMSVSQPRAQAHVTSQRTTVVTSQKQPNSSSVKPIPGSSGFGMVVRTKQPSPVAPASPAVKQEDSWDSFDDWEASIPTEPQPQPNTSAKPTKLSRFETCSPQPSIPSTVFNEAQPGELPPTNVPPPGVLLTLFPPLFEEAQSKLFKPMAAQPLPMRNKLLADPGTIAYLEGYLVLASVAARIIAGRKLRWKRDAHLSQGMRIGPASSRATSGMKLTGVDKSENMKEEREASDVVRVWKDQVGRLRHVVAAANQIKAGTLGAIPDIQETMPVRTLKQSQGGIPSRQPCMMCGLKREERVGAADQAVQDSFGEWWVDQVMMHRGCRNFWNEHKDGLRQR